MSDSILLETKDYNFRLPQALLKGIYTCLEDMIFNNSYSDKAVHTMLQAHKKVWGSRDRKIATSIVYDIARNYLLYQYILDAIKIDDENQINHLIAISIIQQELAPTLLNNSENLSSKIDTVKDIPVSIKHGISPWLYSEIEKDWGSQTDEILASLNQIAPIYIRPNYLRTTTQKLIKFLEKSKIDYTFSSQVKGTIQINQANQIRKSRAFNDGLFEFQDIGSQYVIKQIAIKHHQTIVDYCAGKGGKTLQIASLTSNTGEIIASDIDTDRLSFLNFRAERAGVKNLQILDQNTLLDSQIKADVVLIDAPCSGTGTFRRQPDLKYRLEKSQIEELVQTQAEVLEQAKSLVKENGQLVYITCSILKKENHQQVENFLQNNPSFQLIKEESVLPNNLNSDAFYYAILKKE